MKCILITLSLFVFGINLNQAQNLRTNGKIIKDFGPTFKVESPDIKTDTTAILKVIFDVSQSSEKRDMANKYIETAARFLNMHADAGMDSSQLHVAMTIHGGAWQDVLTDAVYMEKFGTLNPNTALINALSDANVDVIICGQTAGARGMNKEDVNTNVKFALSAMTALLQYQNQGYRFIKF